MKYISTNNLTAIVYPDGRVRNYKSLTVTKSEYICWNSRDLICTSFFGVSDEEFTKEYVQNKVDEVYSTFATIKK